MLRLLIVDDEPIIADGLHDLFSSRYPEELEVLRVYSAQEAIQIFTQARVDIIISDIEMPKMDGITLMNEVRARWSYCRVIFLTGHDRFNYAYEAISGGVSAFILKTEADDKILAAVDRCIEEIVRENDNDEFIQRLQAELDESHILMQREILLNLLRGKLPVEVCTAKFESHSIQLQAGRPCVLVCGRADDMPYAEDMAEKQAKIKTLFYQYTRAIGSSFLFFENNDRYLHGIIQPEAPRQGAAVLISEALEHMQDACISITGLKVSFIVDDQEVALNKLPERFSELSHFVRYWLNGKLSPQLFQASYFTQRIDAGELADMRSRTARAEIINRLRAAVENADQAGFEECLGQVKKMLAGMDEQSLLRMEILSSIIVCLASFINRHRLTGKLPRATYPALQSVLYETPETIFESLDSLSQTIFSAAAGAEYSKDEALVRNIHQYIADHMSQSITLLELAEYMHFNSAYMARLYKQITGHNLTDVILEIKMMQAQELIHQSPHLKINEIAEKTGFQYPAYFARVFKKRFGISPQEYREKQS